MRIGTGFDMHKFCKDRPLVLGGVAIDFELGLEGDSDADVLTHSVIDAILGAANLGDIGSYFGVGTKEVLGARSLGLLEKAIKAVEKTGLAVMNTDSTIVAQEPNLSVYRTKMRQNLARTLSVSSKDVSVKFTTPKGMGPLGAKEGIAAITTVLLEEKHD